MLKIVHSAKPAIKVGKPRKRVPMYRDPVFMAQLKRAIIDDHNRRIKKRNAKNGNEQTDGSGDGIAAALGPVGLYGLAIMVAQKIPL